MDTIEDLDTGSTQDILTEILEAAEHLYEETKAVDVLSRRIVKRLKRDVHPDTPLTPKPVLSAWLQAQGYDQETISFETFFELFLSNCESLDYESLTCILKKEEAKLFKLNSAEPVSIFSVLIQIPSLFH